MPTRDAFQLSIHQRRTSFENRHLKNVKRELSELRLSVAFKMSNFDAAFFSFRHIDFVSVFANDGRNYEDLTRQDI